jgi:hypothetical protein
LGGVAILADRVGASLDALWAAGHRIHPRNWAPAARPATTEWPSASFLGRQRNSSVS